MFAIIVRRLMQSALVMLGSTMVVFLLITLGSPGPTASFLGGRPAPTQDFLDGINHRMRWDESIPLRYWHWLGDLAHGSFGPTVRPGRTIGAILEPRMWVTLRLVVAAVLVALLLGVVTGIIGAVRQYTFIDYSSTFVGFLFLAMPSFWLAEIVKELAIAYNRATGTHFFETIQEATPPALMPGATAWDKFVDVTGHMVLPTLSLALVTYASWSRYTRASVLETMNADYIRLARAKGLRWRRVLIHHALRNALIPLTTVTALDIGALLGGTVITESVFQWHGMGEFLVDSINNVDVYATLAWLLVAGLVVIFFNLVADLLYGVLDPRIRHA